MSTKKDKFSKKDKTFMKLALNLAKARHGLTGVNPSVGCVIVKNNEILSIGQTGFDGTPHAEFNAIKNSNENLEDTKMYVTLEPCSHYGKTPPCTNIIIKNKIKDKKAIHSSLGAEFFIDNYKGMSGHEKRNYNEYSNEHPIVRTHPETGKKILYVNWTYTKQIVGLEKKENDEILKEIFEHQARLDLTCRFNWTENAVAIWDNRSVIHYAIADFYPGRGLGHERIMDRIAIEGDQPH